MLSTGVCQGHIPSTMARSRPLTTTSFAILGMLALRPWRTYDLAKQARRSLRHIWPRAESNLYAEAKRLVAGGYATAQREQTGERQRTVYKISGRGREALREWLSRPGGEVHLESEPLLKVFFAEQGAKSDLLGTIRAIGAAAEKQQGILRDMAQEYHDGVGPFPERLAVSVLALSLVWDHLQATIAWSRHAEAAVLQWRKPGPGEVPPWPASLMPPHGMALPEADRGSPPRRKTK
jgi:PadR family transcriptional regulator, regulatory protein AphA